MEENKSKSKLLGNSLLYTVSGLLSKGIHFILLPVYTVFLSTEDYGILNIVTGFNAVMNYVIIFCLDSAVMKFYAEYKGDSKKLKRFYGTVLTIVPISSVIMILICFLLKDVLDKTVFKGVDFFPFVVLGLVILVLDAFFTIHRRMLEARQDGRKVAIISTVTVAVSSLITVLLIGFFKTGVKGVLIATCVVSLGTVIYMFYDIVKNRMAVFCFDKNLASEALKYSVPLIPHQTASYVATLVSKIFLNTTGSLSGVGLYSIAMQFSSVIDTFQDSMSRAYRPWLFDKINNYSEELKRDIRTTSSLLMALYTIVYVGVGVFSQEIILVMTDEAYHNAWKVVPVLVVSYSVRSIYYFYISQCLYYRNSSKKIFISSLTSSFCNIIVAAILVPQMGMYGSAIASLISITVNTTMIIVINRKNADIGYKLPSFIFKLAISWAFIALGTAPAYMMLNNTLSFKAILYKCVVVAGYILLVYFSNKRLISEFMGTANLIEIIKKLIKRKVD